MMQARLHLRRVACPLGIVIFLGGAGCAEEAPRVHLPLPPVGDALTLVVVVDEGRSSKASALDVRATVSVSLELDDREAAELKLSALGFRCPIDRLGLSEGELGGALPSAGTFALPDARFEATVSRGTASAWRPLTELGERVRSALPFALAPQRSCVSFNRRIVRLPGSEALSRLIAYAPDRVLVTSRPGLFHVVTASATIELTGIATTTPSRAGFVDGNGEVWLMDLQGRLAKGHPDRGFETLGDDVRAPVPDDVRDLTLDGSHAAGETELFFASDELGAYLADAGWFTRGRWQKLVNGAAAVRQGAVGVRWIGPGQALFGLGSELGVVHADQGRLTVEPLPDRIDRPRTFADIPGLGIAMGTMGGTIVAGRPGAWLEIVPRTSPFDDNAVRGIAALDRGLIYLRSNASIHQWHPDDADCGFLFPGRESSAGPEGAVGLNGIAPLGEGFVVQPGFTGSLEPLNGELYLLDRVPRDPCIIDDGTRGSGWLE